MDWDWDSSILNKGKNKSNDRGIEWDNDGYMANDRQGQKQRHDPFQGQRHE